MSFNFTNTQPDYSQTLVKLAFQEVLLQRVQEDLENFKQEFSSPNVAKSIGESFSINIQLKISNYTSELKNEIKNLKKKKSNYKSKFSGAADVYEGYSLDVKDNISDLDTFYNEYYSLLLKAEIEEIDINLVESDHVFEYKLRIESLMNDWVRALKLVPLPEQFEAVAYPPIFVSKNDELNTNHTEVAVDGIYPNVEFYYADNNEPVRNRYVLHWQYEDGSDEVSVSNPPGRMWHYAMGPIGFGQTTEAGRLVKAPIDITDQKYQYNIKVTQNNQFESQYRHGDAPEVDPIIHNIMLNKGISQKELNDDRGYFYDPQEHLKRFNNDDKSFDAYALAYLKNFDPKIKHGFMLYPLDFGPFKTKDVNELKSIQIPDYPNKVELVYNDTLKQNQYVVKIPLHCTLPEWNHRLLEKVKVLELAIETHNILCIPHQRNIANLARMSALTELQLEHSFDHVNDDEILKRTELATSIKEFYGIIETQLAEPYLEHQDGAAVVLNDFFWIRDQKSKINDAAMVLWELLSSTAFIAEIKYYLDHTAGGKIVDGKYPAGPYMAEETNWNIIFKTIATCYSALAHSEKVADLVWDNDIKEGIIKLASLDGVTEQIPDITELWKEEMGEQRPEFVNDDQIEEFIKLTQAEKDKNKPAEGLLATIFDNFNITVENYDSSGIKRVLEQVIPTAGPPCLLQVVLDKYNTSLMRLMLQRIKGSDVTFHLRVFVSVMTVNQLKLVGKLNGKMEFSVFRRIYLSFAVKLKVETRFAYVPVGKTQLTRLFEDLGKSEDKVYKHFNNAYGATGKTIFTVFNMALTLQGMAATLNGRNFTQLTDFETTKVINDFLSVALGAGSTTALVSRISSSLVKSGDASKLLKIDDFLSGKLEKLAVFLGYMSSYIAFWQANEFIEDKKYRQAIEKYAAGIGSFTLTSGFILKSLLVSAELVGNRFIQRMAVSMTTNGIAGHLIVAGTIINLGLLVWDSLEIANSLISLFANDNTNNIKGLWESINSSQVASTDVQYLHDKLNGLREKHGLVSDYLVNIDAVYPISVEKQQKRLDEAQELDSQIILALKVLTQLQLQKYGFSTNFISDDDTGRGSSITRVTSPYDSYRTIDPITDVDIKQVMLMDKIEMLYFDEFLTIRPYSKEDKFDTDGVDWGDLSWRAVIPLHLLGFKVDEIEDMVNLGDIEKDWQESAQELIPFTDFDDSIRSVQDIVDYYQVATTQENAELLDPVRDETVVALLQSGSFTPDPNADYFKAHLWQSTGFQLQAARSGLMTKT